MDNFYQDERKVKLTVTIKQAISKDELLLKVEDCYLGYMDLTIFYREQETTVLHPIAQGILQLLEIESPKKISELGELFCVDNAFIFQAVQQLQHAQKITLSEDELIFAVEQVNKTSGNIYSQSYIINPKMLKIVDYQSFYHVPSDLIVSNDVEITTKDILKLLPDIEEKQIDSWISQPVAGPHMFKVTIYDKKKNIKRIMLYNEDGQELYEVERTEVDLTHLLVEQMEPTSILTAKEGLESLEDNVRWIITVKDTIPNEILSFIQKIQNRTLILIGEEVTSEQIKTLDLIENRSKGLLTVIQVNHPFDLLCINEKKVLQSFSNNQFAMYTDLMFIQSKQFEIQRLLVTVAKSVQHSSSLKAFIYLVEQKIDTETLQVIINAISTICTSNDLVHRGKILDNHGYKELAKEVYNLGIQAHAREVNL